MKHLGGDGSPLHLSLSSLGLSEELTTLALKNGYKTLYDFQQMSIAELLALGWFTAPMFHELTTVLKKLHKLVSP
jgi:hypothetical protein